MDERQAGLAPRVLVLGFAAQHQHPIFLQRRSYPHAELSLHARRIQFSSFTKSPHRTMRGNKAGTIFLSHFPGIVEKALDRPLAMTAGAVQATFFPSKSLCVHDAHYEYYHTHILLKSTHS